MATYYINAESGSPAWPFSGSGTGAHSFSDLSTGLTNNATSIQDSDIIQLVYTATEIVESGQISLPVSGSGVVQVLGDNANKPVIKMPAGNPCFRILTKQYEVSDVHFKLEGSLTGDVFLFRAETGGQIKIRRSILEWKSPSGIPNVQAGLDLRSGVNLVDSCLFIHMNTWGGYVLGCSAEVYNNVFYNCGRYNWGGTTVSNNAGAFGSHPGGGTVKLANNIVITDASRTAFGFTQYNTSSAPLTSDNNHMYLVGGGTAFRNYTPGASDVAAGADPLVTDPVNYDVHLGAGSPCIDSGTNNTGTWPQLSATDFYNATRSGSWDKGAAEYSVVATYIDLGIAVSGAGTSGDPWGRDKLGGPLWPAGDVFVKGSYDVGGSGTYINLNNSAPTHVKRWGSEPWRVRSTGGSLTIYTLGVVGHIVEDGIFSITGALKQISSNLAATGTMEYRGCLFDSGDARQIIAEGSTPGTGYRIVFKGCTFINSDRGVGTQNGVRMDFHDCIMDVPHMFQWDGTAVEFRHTRCVFTASQVVYESAESGTNPVTNVSYISSPQFSWSAPTWPAWNANQVTWENDALVAGINSPPSPGTVPYTDYAINAWGTTRDEIGFVGIALSVISPAITVQPTAQLTKIGSTAVFNLTATGTAPLVYQWYKNGSPVGTDSSTYTTPVTTGTDNNQDVYCNVSNAGGNLNSATVKLNVLATGTIYLNLDSASNGGNGSGADATNYIGTDSWDSYQSDFGPDILENNDHVKMKGSSTFGLFIEDSATGLVFEDWDLDAFGPFRVQAGAFIVPADSLIKNAILDVNDNDWDIGNIEDCFVYLNDYLTLLYLGALRTSFITVDAFSGYIALNNSGAKDYVFTDCVFGPDVTSGPEAQIVDSSSANSLSLVHCASTTPNIQPFPDAIFREASPVITGTPTLSQTLASIPSFGEVDLSLYNVLPGYGVGAVGSWAASPKPVWASTYPKAGALGGNTIEVLSQTDLNGFTYAVALSPLASAPSSQQVKDGEDSTGTPVAAGNAVSAALVADTEANMFLTNLTSETAYDIYVVAEATELQDDPVKFTAVTTDITNPLNAAGYPKVNIIDETATSFLAKTNEAGNAYLVVVPRGDSAPTSVQTKAGEDSTSTVVAAGFSASVALTANVESILTATNLTIGTKYDAYIVCEDDSLNLQAAPVKVEFSTLPKIISQTNVPASYIGSHVVINLNGLIVSTDRLYPGAFTIAVVAGGQYEIVPYTGLENDGTKVRVKILSATDDECSVSIKVNDEEHNSNIFAYKIAIVAGSEKPKTKPTGYAIDVTTDR